MQKEAMSRHRAHSPFDDSAIERLGKSVKELSTHLKPLNLARVSL